MAKLPSCLSFNSGTFSATSLTALPANSVINLTQQVLAGTSISFTPPNTINLQPGNYIIRYSFMGQPTNSAFLLSIGLQLNNFIIIQSSIGASSNASTSPYPQTGGSSLITIEFTSTLRLVALTPVAYPTAVINTAITNNNIQTAQLTIFKL